jgi:hypothetical protein
MSLDNPTAPPAAASELPAAPLDGIEIPSEGAAEHLPEVPAEGAAAARISALPAAPANDEAAAAATDSGSAENSREKQRGRPFEPGQSGNPNGRPKGARNRVTRAVEALIDGQGEALGAKAVEKALNGDSPMLRALLGTLVPPRERTVEFELPKIESAADAVKASSAVITACAAGELSPHEATAIMGLISTHVRAIEVAELETRVAALENDRSPAEKKVGFERWQELHDLRESRGMLTHEDDTECSSLELQAGEVGDKIRAEIARENAAHEAHLKKLRAGGAIK